VIILDTTVLIYSGGADHRLKAPCRALVTAITVGQVRATTTVEVIQEFCHVAARRAGRLEASQRAQNYSDLLGPLLQVGSEDLTDALGLFASVGSQLGSFDSVLAAVARRRRLPLVSADRGFGSVPGLDVLDPSSASFLEDCLAFG
jgi:uncharacterized protein